VALVAEPLEALAFELGEADAVGGVGASSGQITTLPRELPWNPNRAFGS
jgi:hypothetical protein